MTNISKVLSNDAILIEELLDSWWTNTLSLHTVLTYISKGLSNDEILIEKLIDSRIEKYA